MAEGLRDSGYSGVVKARASFSDDITEPSLPRPSHVEERRVGLFKCSSAII